MLDGGGDGEGTAGFGVCRSSQAPPSLDYVGEPKKGNNPLKEGEDEVLK